MACGLVKDLGEGVSLSRDVQRSGKANTVLDDWIKLSQVRFSGLIKSLLLELLCSDPYPYFARLTVLLFCPEIESRRITLVNARFEFHIFFCP